MTKTKPEPPIPPANVSEKFRLLWDEAMRSHRCWNPTRLEALRQTLASLDRADEAKAAVDEEGLTTRTEATGAIHINPAAKAEREFRQQGLRGLEQLGLLHLGGPILATQDD